VRPDEPVTADSQQRILAEQEQQQKQAMQKLQVRYRRYCATIAQSIPFLLLSSFARTTTFVYRSRLFAFTLPLIDGGGVVLAEVVDLVA